ncbi:MAG: hypothetical protein SV422_09420 [Pseudomonadota bacterium]|nr:hypothetical protein [Pseudomonadota bacterium]
MYRHLFTGLLALFPLCASAQVYDRAPDCDRACLTSFMDRYLQAQAANALGDLPIAPTARVTENGDLIDAGTGFFQRADEPTYRMDIADPETGGVASALVVNAGDVQAFEMVRLKVEGAQITEIETVVAFEGDSGPMFVPDFATEPRRDFLLTLLPREQNSRLELMAVADAYWRALETNGRPDYRPAPMLPGVVRIENGMPTSNGAMPEVSTGGPAGTLDASATQQFDEGRFVSRTIFDRRFPVVDVERGVILSIARMGVDADQPEPPHWKGGRPLLAEFFAVQDGRITAVEVIMKSDVPLEQQRVWERSPLARSKSDP